MKLNLGAGNDVRNGFVNHDSTALPGIDVVHDLDQFPYPWDDGTFDEIVAQHLLEHLPDTIRTVEELHRISKPGAKVVIRVPFYNSQDMATDPTHVRFFNQFSFDYFDPTKRHCIERPYYSSARFSIDRIVVFSRFFRYREHGPGLIQKLLLWLAGYLGNIVWVIEYRLTALK